MTYAEAIMSEPALAEGESRRVRAVFDVHAACDDGCFTACSNSVIRSLQKDERGGLRGRLRGRLPLETKPTKPPVMVLNPASAVAWNMSVDPKDMGGANVRRVAR